MTLFQHQNLLRETEYCVLCVDVSSSPEGDSSTGTGFRIEWIWSFGPEMLDYNVADIGHVTPF